MILGRPTVPQVLKLVREYVSRPGNDNGGLLHVVLCDYNVDDWYVWWCWGQAYEERDELAREIAKKLFCMSRTQRLKVAKSWRR